MTNFIYINRNPAPVVSTVTYLGQGNSFNIGVARPDCLIVTCGFTENDSASGSSAWAIAGVTGTLVYGGSSSDRMAMVYRNVTTGGTISTGGLGFNFAWMINGLTNNTLFTSNLAGNSGGTITTTVSTPTGVASCIINMARSMGSFGSNTLTASGAGYGGTATLNFAANTGGGGNPGIMGGFVRTNGLGGNVAVVDTASGWSAGLGLSATFY